MKKNRAIYQLKVVLRDIHPLIWRRIQVWEDSTLAQLHRVLQIVMSWENYHLHDFVIGRRRYSVPDRNDDLYERKTIDERYIRIRDVITSVGMQFGYLYDFGDSWYHDLLLEAILMPEPNLPYPRCVAGERSTPPEDVGGTMGYENYLEAMQDSDHEEHAAMMLWRGSFDPESFSVSDVNQQLHNRFLSRKKATPASVLEPPPTLLQ